MGRLANTWSLAKTSWGVLKKDRELLVLPVLSFVISAAVLAVVAVVYLLSLSVGEGSVEGSVNGLAIVLGLVAVFAVGLVTVFFKGALVAGAHERLSGGDPTVSSGISRAFSRLGGLVPWALITSTVGLILSVLRDRAGGLGEFVVRLIGAAWDVVTFLTIPAIVVDGLSAVPALKRSASLLRQTWGENLASQAGFGILGFLLVIPGAVVGGLAGASGVTVVAVAGIAVAVAWIAVVLVVIAALSAIFQTALYLYATTGVSPVGFENAGLQQSFAPKQTRGAAGR